MKQTDSLFGLIDRVCISHRVNLELSAVSGGGRRCSISVVFLPELQNADVLRLIIVGKCRMFKQHSVGASTCFGGNWEVVAISECERWAGKV